MTTATPNTVETLLVNAPESCQATAHLFSWATNYDAKTGSPWAVFLDLIGFTAEYISAEPLVKNPTEFMGYLELDMLADALKEYATRPDVVENFCCALVATELGL